MATRRKVGERRELDREHSSTPTQEDEGDILEEAGAHPDDSGELQAPEEKIRELGAVDADSVRENRRLESIVGKKRANMPNVSFNTGDVISTYDTVLKVWPANTIDISVRRLTGTPIQNVIVSRPRSGAELYQALLQFHGLHEEAEYEIKFLDSSRKEWRGKGRIAMPDTRPPSQQGQPMNYYPGVPPGYAPPHPYQPPATSYPPQPQQPVPGVPAQPPIMMQAPSGPDMNSMLTSFQQMFEMFQAMQRNAAPAPPSSYTPPAPVMPPMPPPSDPNAQMAWMQRAFEMFQSMQTPAAPAHSAPQPPPQAPNPMMGMMPPVQPPPGMMFVPGFGFVSVEQLMQAVGAPRSGPGPGMGPRPYRPPYSGEGGGPPPYTGPREPPPQRERTAAEQFKDAISVVRAAGQAMSEINSILPNAMGAVADAVAPTDDDDGPSPVKVIDTGRGKFVLDKSNGGFRGWESFYANLPDLLKWGAEQREAIQKMNTEHQQRQRPQQLPPGYVEVGPGYQPPPGFVAVPVDPQQQLPPPPSNMPPPIQSQQPWGAPMVPDREE
jgi:hypothetical protein